MSLKESKQSMNQRQRNILYLIEQYLRDCGLKQSQAELCAEANLSNEYEVCDNIDLDTIFLDYCSYFHLKFGKQPKVLKRIESGVDAVQQNYRVKLNRTKSNGVIDRKPDSHSKTVAETKNQSAESLLGESVIGRGMSGDGLLKNDESVALINSQFQLMDNLTPEMKELTHCIERDIVKRNYGIKWDDIQGNQHAKDVLYECVILPLKHPNLFANLTKPWKGVLMHGPSGVGKTFLAKALSSETFGSVTFFNILSSTLISKWRGESEKFLKILFTMAKCSAPSVIFIDEFESLASRRDSPNEHEATKRFKNELLIQIDELDCSGEHVLLLANTNLPWEIDIAFLRRFERKILIDMPDAECRVSIIKALLPHTAKWSGHLLNQLVNTCDGFTGADLKIACKEASLHQLRKALRRKCNGLDEVETVAFDDLMSALKQIQPIMSEMAAKHRQWNTKYGNILI